MGFPTYPTARTRHLDLEFFADKMEEEAELQRELNEEEEVPDEDLCGRCEKEIEDERKRGHKTVCKSCRGQMLLSEWYAGVL